MSYISYIGMTYEQASREAARLIHKAHKTGDWYALPEKLITLRIIMNRYLDQVVREEMAA